MVKKKRARDGDGDGDGEQAKEPRIERQVTNAAGSSERSYTVSMAVSASIVNNAQSLELATRLAGQVARAAAIFRIDEIVVFEDGESSASSFQRANWGRDTGEQTGGEFLARVLRYLEAPQYLRRALFPIHSSLSYAGRLPPLDTPHHLRMQAWLPYREGVVLAKPVENNRVGSYVNVGLEQDAIIHDVLKPGTRVTVEMGTSNKSFNKGRKLKVVASSTPREVGGLYWGYTVRVVNTLSDVFEGSPYEIGYDYCIGTSEHGEKISSGSLNIPNFKHLLVVFGGPAGLEESLELEQTAKVKEVKQLFNKYLNTCPHQGSRTIRTEEAILISLQFLQEPILRAVQADAL